MKKTFKILTIATAIATLTSCGGGTNTQQQNGAEGAGADAGTDAGTDAINRVSTDDGNGTVEITDNVAYEVAKQLNEMAKDYPADEKDNKLYYTFSYNDEEDITNTPTVQCYPHSDGGFLALYTETREGFIGDGFIDAVSKFKAYIYKDGKLTPKQDILPQPKYEDFEANDELLAKARKSDFEKECKGADDYVYRLISGERIKVGALYEEEFPYAFYEWKGSKFEQFNSTFDNRHFNVIRPGRLASLQVGSPAPKELKGYNSETTGNQILFNRSGHDEFTLSVGKDGTIDTITIINGRLTYAMCAAGGCNPFGVDFSPVDDAFGMQYNGITDYFIFKKGVWVRVLESPDGIIEFYTTKDAIKDKKGSEGMKIEPSKDDPWSTQSIANQNAKVTKIKIFKKPSFCNSCNDISDQQKTEIIRSMYYAISNDKILDQKHLEIEDPESGYPCDYDYFYKDGKLVMVEFSTGDGTMVNKKIYIEDGYPYFCFSVTTYPDNTKNEERIYMCAGKIYKFLDNSKKELNVNTDDAAVKGQASINSIITIAKDNESKAK